jgi:hypothetical protein
MGEGRDPRSYTVDMCSGDHQLLKWSFIWIILSIKSVGRRWLADEKHQAS